MFLQKFSCSFWEQGWATRTLFSKCQGPVLWLLVAASDHRDTDTETGSHCSGISLSCCKSLSSRSYFRGTLITSSFFLFFWYCHFGESDIRHQGIQKKVYLWGKCKSHHTYSGKNTGPEKTWKDLKLTFQVDFQHRNSL